MDVQAADVIGFWFGPPPLAPRKEWFVKNEAFDATVRSRFGACVEAALADALPPTWQAQPLAEILLLDQCTRNIFRGSARAYAGDSRALALARAVVASGDDRRLHPVQRAFVYLPYEHAEDLTAQDDAVRLFGALVAEDPGQADLLDYAQRHRDVIRRFGRFPHRNAPLGRTSTAEEAAFVQQPGTGF